MNYKTFGIICLLAALALLGTVAYHNSTKSQVPIVFSARDMLATTWDNYKKGYIESSTGRTVDHQHNDVTTSEGQSYTMLRAVWMDDQAAFNQSWHWTQQFLTQPNSHLFSWLYGKRPDSSYGVRTDIGGQNSASDADTDIALALIFAYSRWQDKAYVDSARAIISDIWDKEVVMIQGKPYLAANDLEKSLSTPTIVMNPSYISPGTYKIFASVDRDHAWDKLADASYQVLKATMQSRLDKTQSAHIPPDWILVDRATGAISAGTAANLSTNYSFDAMRVPWRLALDWQWSQDSRAKDILSDMDFLKNQWRSKGLLYAGYGHDGQSANNFESPAVYGASLGYFLTEDAQDANAIYNQKLLALYNPDTNSWKEPLSYYDDNWAWFGLALYYNFLPNLASASLSAMTN
jgi:endoglucanase